ncbi:AAA family ATPase [Bradyrhizobium sp. 24]|uniref:ATP-binding protein n=1 Tax=Bradyrhizobium sp. 37 TaxID=2782671 RepID=UPI001FF7BE94|nr:ATP-binding protein [Bradyrhizobium sp. 37]MCK1298144.1 AAA family ATPase [Bradyrhizobium sp. 37]MCK1377790.1 AAA family ATPase [Bradyrhizobium sp. 24]MCK1773170.1 AAA family ATPase [Bradyrhizobium sp. 134]
MRRFIVFGVSGVGKTTACLDFVTRHPLFLFLSASSLIAEAKGVSLKSLRTASVQQLIANQEVLQLAVEHRLQKHGSSSFILDGQCVLDNGSEIVVLPAEAIAPFRANGLILLEAPASTIFDRRSRDDRERPQRSIEEIAEQLAMNREAVQRYATHLKVPFVFAEAKEELSLDGVVEELSNSL